MEAVGKYLRTLREQRRGGRLSRDKVAKLIGVGRVTIERLESGDQNTGFLSVLRLVEFLDGDPRALIELAHEGVTPEEGERRALEWLENRLAAHADQAVLTTEIQRLRADLQQVQATLSESGQRKPRTSGA